MDHLALSTVLGSKNTILVELYNLKEESKFINQAIEEIASDYKEIIYVVSQGNVTLEDYLQYSFVEDEIYGRHFDKTRHEKYFLEEIQPKITKYEKLLDKLLYSNHNSNFNLGILNGFILAYSLEDKLRYHYNLPVVDKNDLEKYKKILNDKKIFSFFLSQQDKERELDKKINMLLTGSNCLHGEFGYGFLTE